MWNRRTEGGEGEGTKFEMVKQNVGRQEFETVQQKKRKNRKLKPWKQRVSQSISVEKVLDLGFYGGIKVIRSGLYDGDRVHNYFIFISILKLIKLF